jgi:hypothetical protein
MHLSTSRKTDRHLDTGEYGDSRDRIRATNWRARRLAYVKFPGTDHDRCLTIWQPVLEDPETYVPEPYGFKCTSY